MADLGSPGYTPVITETGENEYGELAAGISGAISATNELMTEAKSRNLRGNLGTIAEAGLDAATSPLPGPDPADSGERFTTPAEQQLYQNLQKWNQQVSQASGSVKAAVINRAKREVANATANNPALRRELASEFQLFVATDPNLDAIGLADAARSSGGAMAQKQLEEIFDNAYGDVKDGGLGIPAHIEFGSDNFIRLYSNAAQIEADTNAKTLMLNNLSAQDEVDIYQLVPAIEQALHSNNNNVDATFAAQQAQLGGVAEAMNRVAQGKGSQTDNDVLVAFETVTRDQYLSAYDQYKGELIGIKNSIPASQYDTDLGQNAIAKIDSGIDYIERWQAAIEQLTTNPSLVKAMEIESDIRKSNWRRANPEVEELSYGVDQLKPLFEHADVIGLDDRILQDDIGNRVIPPLREWITDSYNFGTSSYNNDGMTREDIRSSVTRQRQLAPHPYGPNADEQQRATEAFLKLVNANKRHADAYQVYADAGIQVPEAIIGSYGAQIAHVGELHDGRNYQPDTLEGLISMYTDPKGVKVVQSLRETPGSTPTQQNVVGALGDELLDYYNDQPNGGPEARKVRMFQETKKTFGRVPFDTIMEVDWSELDEGVVTISPTAGAAGSVLAAKDDQRGASRFTSGTSTSSDLKRQERELQQYADYLSAKITKELQFVGNINYMRNTVLKKPNYVATWDAEGFNQIVQRPGE